MIFGEIDVDTVKFVHRGKKFEFLVHSENEQMAYHLRKEGTFFEHDPLDYLADNFQNHRTIIDVGANIGNHSVYFHEFLNCDQIISFEIHPINYAVLVINTFDYDKCKPMNFAVSNYTGVCHVSTNKYNMGMCQISKKIEKHCADMVTIDSFHFENVTLIKIDTEGNELDVLGGAKNTIEIFHPMIMIEMATENYRRYDSHLQAIGYKQVRYWKDKIVGLYKCA